jgi:hypothetical protein
MTLPPGGLLMEGEWVQAFQIPSDNPRMGTKIRAWCQWSILAGLTPRPGLDSELIRVFTVFKPYLYESDTRHFESQAHWGYYAAPYGFVPLQPARCGRHPRLIDPPAMGLLRPDQYPATVVTRRGLLYWSKCCIARYPTRRCSCSP